MRQFELINADGERWNVTETKTFLHSVSGLGYEFTQDIQRYGDNYDTYYEVLAQKKVTGKVYFGEDASGDYHRFIRFLQNKPLRLAYKPENETYYLSGNVAIVGKAETDAKTATIEFRGSTPWYKVVNTFNNGILPDNGGFSYTFDFFFTEDAPQTVSVDSDSYTESPVRFEIYGPCINPSWTQYVDNKVVCTGKVNITVPSNRKLVVDTTGMTPSITEVDLANRLVQDLYGFSDFSTPRFMALKHGKNRITVEHDGNNIVKVAMEARITYASV